VRVRDRVGLPAERDLRLLVSVTMVTTVGRSRRAIALASAVLGPGHGGVVDPGLVLVARTAVQAGGVLYGGSTSTTVPLEA
jgi:hypothetical protein